MEKLLLFFLDAIKVPVDCLLQINKLVVKSERAQLDEWLRDPEISKRINEQILKGETTIEI